MKKCALFHYSDAFFRDALVEHIIITLPILYVDYYYVHKLDIYHASVLPPFSLPVFGVLQYVYRSNSVISKNRGGGDKD
jgi:hypothetical protein